MTTPGVAPTIPGFKGPSSPAPGTPAASTSSGSTSTGLGSGYQVPTIPNPYAEIPGNPNVSPTQTIYSTSVNPTPYNLSTDPYTLPYSDQESIPQLQAQLVQAGLLSAKQVRVGQWDATSANAYATVLNFANHFGLNAQQAMSVYLNNPKLGSAGSAASGGKQTRLGAGVGGQGYNYFFPEYNPANIATGFQNVSQAMTGQEQGSQLPAFQSAFQSAESQAAAGKDTAKLPGSAAGGQYEQKPTPTDFATQYLISHDPSQVQAYGTASRLLDFMQLLGVK